MWLRRAAKPDLHRHGVVAENGNRTFTLGKESPPAPRPKQPAVPQRAGAVRLTPGVTKSFSRPELSPDPRRSPGRAVSGRSLSPVGLQPNREPSRANVVAGNPGRMQFRPVARSSTREPVPRETVTHGQALQVRRTERIPERSASTLRPTRAPVTRRTSAGVEPTSGYSTPVPTFAFPSPLKQTPRTTTLRPAGARPVAATPSTRAPRVVPTVQPAVPGLLGGPPGLQPRWRG